MTATTPPNRRAGNGARVVRASSLAPVIATAVGLRCASDGDPAPAARALAVWLAGTSAGLTAL